jgi:hypothetical protein
VTAARAIEASHRRRRVAPSQAGATALAAIMQPVAGTAAAQRAQDLAASRAGTGRDARPHVLLDPDLESRPDSPKVGMPKGMSPMEIADRIVAVLLQGSGPILLCVPGTLGQAYQSSMLSLARAVVKQARSSVSVASIPYPNGVLDIVPRFLGIKGDEDQNVLALVLRKLHAAAPDRPILLGGESQGAWLIADTLKADPELAAAVTRVVMFAKPGFVDLPESIGQARNGASMLPGTDSGVHGILEFRHTDDIVPSLFSRLHPGVFTPYLTSLTHGQGMAYPPHHYDWHGSEAARWLLRGVRPTSAPVHESRSHPTHTAHM